MRETLWENKLGVTQLTWVESGVHTAFDERAQSFRR